jgi:hypothetical protein
MPPPPENPLPLNGLRDFSRPTSELIAIAKARVWASEGWLVVISDGKGKSFGPAEFDDLLSFPTR